MIVVFEVQRGSAKEAAKKRAEHADKQALLDAAKAEREVGCCLCQAHAHAHTHTHTHSCLLHWPSVKHREQQQMLVYLASQALQKENCEQQQLIDCLNLRVTKLEEYIVDLEE